MPDEVNIVQDGEGHARHLTYRTGLAVAGRTPQEVAENFLKAQADTFAMPQRAMESLHVRAAIAPIAEAQSLRFESEKRLMDSTVVSYTQTMFGLPVYQAGVSVVIHQPDNRVKAAASTLHYDIAIQPPSAALTANPADAAATGGYDELVRRAIPAAESMRINRTRLLVYRYDAAKRVHSHGGPGKRGFGPETPTLPLPPVPESIRDGQHYIVVEALFSLALTSWGMLNWQAFIEPDTAAVLFLRALVDGATGMVFDRDPITTTGNLANLPSAVSAVLDAIRDNISLVNLGATTGGQQSLSGTYVELANNNLFPPPTEGTPFNFAYVSRTSNFAAANAYYHCDRFFGMIEDLGFGHTTYFSGTAFPVPIDHLGSSNDVNARCNGNALNNGIGSVVFDLADTGDTAHPIGIAADWRVVLHEFAGHGTLWNHVDSPNFGFSHSAGDSVAAIFNDPHSNAPDRFVSFPWMVNVVDRRHDRTPAAGWGWGGDIASHPFDNTLDPGGYNNEQILSTTHFRLYRSIGGDSADAARREFAAQSVVYLILRAIAQLTPSTNAQDALAWEQQLETADAGTWTSVSPAGSYVGGAYHKVIRWAFEKQGLFQASGAQPNDEGAPPAVDVYIDDGRHGEYVFQPNYWSCADIWNRLVADGGGVHQEPMVGQTNFAYARIKNRGTQPATNVVVKGFHHKAGGSLDYPDDFLPMTPPPVNAANLAAGDNVGVVVGPFQWTPSQAGNECMLFSVSATGDASNIDGTITGTISDWRLVPNDNNIAERTVHPLSAGWSSSGAWVPGQTINLVDSTPQAPAACVFNNKLYVFWKANDASNAIWFSASADGNTWPAGKKINEFDSTPLTPAACVFNNQLYVFWKANNSSNAICFSASSDGNTWPGGKTINGFDSTPLTPSACVFNNQLYVFWKANNSSNAICFSASSDGNTWPGGKTINGSDSTPVAPAACVFNNKLYVFWKANDASNAIWFSASADGNTWPAGSPTNDHLLLVTSEAPAARVFNNQLYLFWSWSGFMYYSASSDGVTWEPLAGRMINGTDSTLLPPCPSYVNLVNGGVINTGVYLFWKTNDSSNKIYFSFGPSFGV